MMAKGNRMLGALLLALAICAAPAAAAETEADGNAEQAPWTWAPDQPVGAFLPDFTVTNHQGQPVALSEARGQKGTLLVFSRSTDW